MGKTWNMQNKTNNDFDVLLMDTNQESIDIIQSIMGDDCLGTFLDGNISKLYFNGGNKNKIKNKLMKIMPDLISRSEWKVESSQDWHLAWQKYFKPIIIDQKLAVLPSWNKTYLAKINLFIKPGMAFGTGHHESTWLMLKELLDSIKPNMDVLDLGAGSGILSIAAHLLGATNIDAVENDLECKDNFIENMELNKISNEIIFHHQDVLTWDNFHHDIILANINRNVLEKLIPRFINANGKIILSGLLKSDFNNMKELIDKNGFMVEKHLVKGDWLCLILKTHEN